MITLKSCPVCESYLINEFRVVLGGGLIAEIIPGVKVDAQIITRYCVCRDCNLIFQNPRLSDTELDKYYSTGYYRRTVNMTDEHIDINEMGRAKKDAKIIKQHVGKITSHLDVGCGRGHLLDAIGAKVKVGVESDVDYVSVKGVEAYQKINQVPRKSFDLVTAIHILEHVPAPLDYLKELRKFVYEDGYLIIEVPTWKSPGGPLRLAHLYHFESDVLRLMVKQAGLNIEEVLFTPHLVIICKLDKG